MYYHYCPPTDNYLKIFHEVSWSGFCSFSQSCAFKSGIHHFCHIFCQVAFLLLWLTEFRLNLVVKPEFLVGNQHYRSWFPIWWGRKQRFCCHSMRRLGILQLSHEWYNSGLCRKCHSRTIILLQNKPLMFECLNVWTQLYLQAMIQWFPIFPWSVGLSTVWL